MKTKSVSFTAICLLIGLTLGWTGCQTPASQQGAATGADMEKAAGKVDATEIQIDIILTALTSLVSNPQPDLRPQYKDFTSALSKLDSSIEHFRDVSIEMIEKGNDYFEMWDANLATINNADIRASSEERKAEVHKSFSEVKKRFAEAEVTVAPFSSDMKDIKTFLDTDLTAGGLATIKDIATNAVAHAEPLEKSLKALSTEFRKLGSSLTPITPAAASAAPTE